MPFVRMILICVVNMIILYTTRLPNGRDFLIDTHHCSSQLCRHNKVKYIYYCVFGSSCPDSSVEDC